jgi:CRP-like cAMP-binding protein
MESTVDHLRVNTNLFVGFTMEDLEVLAPAAERRTLEAGETLCNRGEPGSSLYVISVGSIEVRRRVGDSDVALATLSPGEACGEMALVTGARRTADLVAAEDSAVLEITRSNLDEALREHPEVAAKLWHNVAVALSQRLASTNVLLAQYIEINKKLIEDDEFRRAYASQ